MSQIAKWYRIIDKQFSGLLDRITESDLLKEKRNFEKTYKEPPTNKEEVEMKKIIVMRKIGVLFLSVFLVTVLLINK